MLQSMPIVRKEYYADREAIRLVNELAFGQADEADLVDSLRAGGKVTLSLVVEVNRSIAGYILFSPVSIEGFHHPLAALGPMAVVPQMQRHGIGTLLARSGINICRELGVRAIFVLDHADYYSRLGFRPASDFGLHSSWEKVPDEAFLALELERDVLKAISGTVRYAEEFDQACNKKPAPKRGLITLE